MYILFTVGGLLTRQADCWIKYSFFFVLNNNLFFFFV